MNKTLIAMAVAGLMAAPMAAQADATIYGKFHVSLDFGDTGMEDGAGGELSSSTYFQSNSSRIGFKGSEDLGGGLKAIWQVESLVSVGSEGKNNPFGGRNTYVGLQGGWGKVIGGQHDTPFKTTGRKFDLFGDYVGDSRNLIGGIIVDDNFDASGGFDLRPANALMYTTPVFGGGWDINFMYTAEDGEKDTEIMSTNINWKTGDWYTSLAYETHGKGNNDTFDFGAGPVTGDKDETGIRLGVAWTPGAWKLTALYQTMSDVGGLNNWDMDAYGLGAAYKMGKNVLKAQYYLTSNDFAGFTTDVDAALLAVAWDYNFSKRTTGYIAYATTSNDANAYFPVDAGGHGGEIATDAVALAGAGGAIDGKDPSAFSVGVIHKF